MTEGRCNCAGIKITAPTLPKQSLFCYCSNCRRAGSSIGSLVYVFDKSDVSISDPGHHLKSYKDSDTKSGNTVTRQFCGNCGCPIASLLDQSSPEIILKGGIFEKLSPPGMKFFEHEQPTWMRIVNLEEHT
ncbi:hypothetical protein ACN47E_002043 [Coniothyrium glycines]